MSCCDVILLFARGFTLWDLDLGRRPDMLRASLFLVVLSFVCMLLCGHGNNPDTCSSCKREREDAARAAHNAGNANRQNGHKEGQSADGEEVKPKPKK